MPELTETALRQALMDGAFYASYEPNGSDQTSSTYGVAMTSTLSNVIVSKDTIQIEGINIDRIEWYDENTRIISSDFMINVSQVQSNFVRAVLINEHGWTYTQPFGLERIDVTSLPASFSWRNVDGVDFTTPIRDQSPFGSCETFAITAAVETMVQKEVGFPFNCDLSEAHLYFYSGGNYDWGSYPENDTDFLVEYGIPDEACWPYPTEYKMYPLNTTADNWMNRTVKINDWWYLPEDINAIKYALITNGPVPTYFQVFKDFLNYEKGVYRHRWGKCFGIHYVCIVGWNDDPGYWIVKNSWGTKYQDEGWFNIAYGECSIEKKSFYLDGVYGNFPIVYVDDDNSQGPWDGTKNHPFSSIQQGIDAVYDGWCVYVQNGMYHEHLMVNKSIHLIGEDSQLTIVDGDGWGHVMTISSPGVTVTGFTIQRSGIRPFEAGIKTLTLYSNATIYNNIFQDNGIGLFLNYAYSVDYGKTSYNQVYDNIFRQNQEGMYVHWSDNNEIFGNVFTDNFGCGLEMEASRYDHIHNNLFESNGEIGLYLRAKSENNRIISNDFVDNALDAYVDGSFHNSWKRNYWDDSHYFLVKFIKARLLVHDIPFFVVDFLPSLQRNTDLT
jgi:parallel beta-helix repeat protein